MNRGEQFVTRQTLVEFIKYSLASALALAVDYGCYIILATNKVLDLPQAAVAGYIAGLVVAYFLISNGVFQNGWLRDSKKIEAIFFLLSGILGIALTYLVVKVVVLIFGQRLNLAKVAAVTVSFIGVYFFRKKFVFRS